MKTTKRITPIALMITLFILATLLTACGSTPPEYGKVITETPMPATAILESTVTVSTGSTTVPEVTLPPTQRPDAREAALAWTKAAMTYDATEAATAVIDRICALASEYGCWYATQYSNRQELYTKYPNVKSQPVIKSAERVYTGKMQMSDGTTLEYEVWKIDGDHSDSPTNNKKFTRYPTFVWSKENTRWEFFYSPDGWTAKSLDSCGQFVEYAPDGHAYNTEAEWNKVYAQCQTATPPAPTPFVPVTPVFTPKP